MQGCLPEDSGQDPTEARFLEELDKFTGMLSKGNLAPLPDEVAQALFALTPTVALKCLRSMRAAHVRSPVGLLE